MKKNLLKLLLIFLSLNLFAQKKISTELAIGQQKVKKDIGPIYQVGVNYEFKNKSSISLSYAKSNLKNKELDINYDLISYNLNYNYGIMVSKYSSFESVMGISYIDFSNDFELDKNTGFGLNLGIRANYNKGNLGIGFFMINTYSDISPGGILSSSVVFKYKLF